MYSKPFFAILITYESNPAENLRNYMSYTVKTEDINALGHCEKNNGLLKQSHTGT